MGDAGEKIRTAALPFIKWLRGPEGEEEEYSAAYWASVEASEPSDLVAAPPEYDAAMQCPSTDFENLKVRLSVTKPVAAVAVAISLQH